MADQDQGHTQAGGEATAADFRVRRILADLTFLRADNYPDDVLETNASTIPRMPDEIWSVLAEDLRAEQLERERVRRRPRVLTALVAAAAVVIVGGVVVQSQQSSEPAYVATDAVVLPQAGDPSSFATPAAPAAATRDALAQQADPGSSGSDADTRVPTDLGEARLPAPDEESLKQTGLLSPTRRVLASGTDYRAETMGRQIQSVLAELGVTSKRELTDMPQPSDPLGLGGDGFTATQEGLTACIVALHGPVTSLGDQAYLVDRARFAGQDVGVLLFPADDDGVAAGGVVDGSVMPATTPSATLSTDEGVVDIWVVTPECGPLDVTTVHRVLYTLVFPSSP